MAAKTGGLANCRTVTAGGAVHVFHAVAKVGGVICSLQVGPDCKQRKWEGIHVREHGGRHGLGPLHMSAHSAEVLE